MKDKYWLRISVMALVAVLLLAVGVVQGQMPDNEGVDKGSEGDLDSANTEFILAQAPQTINYQGYLTDSNGNPLNGHYDMVFHLYNAVTVGTVVWGPETHTDVQVTDGLFQVALGVTVALQPNHFDEALFLAVSVDGVAITPRQPLRAVPYAFGLIPGAEVEGDPALTNYGLRIENEGEGSTDRGLYVKGWQYGIYAEEVGDSSDVGIYSPDYVHAKGFRSNDDSYLWIPATAGMMSHDPDCITKPQSYGTVIIECSSSAYLTYHIGVNTPAVLYGQEVRIESVLVHYDLDNTGSYISGSYLRRFTNARTSVTLYSDLTTRNSTSPTSYTIYPTANYTMTTASGALNLALSIKHDGDPTHDVAIGGIRLRLRHYDEP